VRERKDDIDIVVIMDYNPGSLFSIQKSEIEEFVIPGSGRDWRLTDIIISTCTEKNCRFSLQSHHLSDSVHLVNENNVIETKVQ